MQSGGRKDFDPEIYRQAIRQYNSSKVAAPRAAYRGAGDILHHPGASRPESQQLPAHSTRAPSRVGGALHSADVMTFDSARGVTPAASMVPPTDVADDGAVGAEANAAELGEPADIAALAAA